MNIVIGTAGHIDHGKTALVRALTGVDTDRLPEEKDRGITIDIGFAEMAIGETAIGFVDVPGHERFVKNMLAGVSGIDAVMMVVAADEGVMPQTREHFEICRLLGVEHGLIAITRSDLATQEEIDIVRAETAGLVRGSFLESAPVFSVSSVRGSGIAKLSAGLSELAAKIHRRSSRRGTRLPIDRSFTVKGFGAVVTGTLIAGSISAGDELELLPAMQKVKVRGVQAYGKHIGKALPGGRAAVNLSGIQHTDIRRGMVLAEKGMLRPTSMIDVEIQVLHTADVLRSLRRVRVHLGTEELLGRIHILDTAGEIAPGESGYAQIRLESPAVASHGDRFIIRSYSPQTTISGGRVLNAHPETKWRRPQFSAAAAILAELGSIAADDDGLPVAFIRHSGQGGIKRQDLSARTGWSKAEIAAALKRLIQRGMIVDAGHALISADEFASLKEKFLAKIGEHHKADHLSQGIGRDELRRTTRDPLISDAVIAELLRERKVVAHGDRIAIAGRTATLSPAETAFRGSLADSLSAAGIQVPKISDAMTAALAVSGLSAAEGNRVLWSMVETGEMIKVSDDLYFLPDQIGDVRSRLAGYAARHESREIDVSCFKKLTGLSRKYAIPLLEYFDRQKVTLRVGDKRIIR